MNIFQLKKPVSASIMKKIPPILKPNFNLLGLNVGEDRALSDQLLPAKRARLRALMIQPLKGFDLLRSVSNVLSGVHSSLRFFARSNSHHLSTVSKNRSSSQTPAPSFFNQSYDFFFLLTISHCKEILFNIKLNFRSPLLVNL